MPRRSRWVCRARAAVLLLAIALPTGVALGAYTPGADELALLALTNEARAQAGLRPLVWHDGLGRSARDHSTDMAIHGCYQHNSCNGQSWTARISSYYPSWLTLGENIGLGGGDPRAMHEAWMATSGHRANILGSYSEFGAGIAFVQTNFGEWGYTTEVFGDRGAIALSSIPTLPAGGVMPRVGLSATRELLVNFYHLNGGAPQAVRALVGSACVPLARTAGSASNASYGATRTFTGSGCVPVVFEAIRSDGVRQRWPAGKALLVGVGTAGLSCAETTTAVPTQDCGGGGMPPATPTPAPTPAGGGAALTNLRVVLRPGKSNPAVGTVNVQATLPSLASFDPSATPVSFAIGSGQSTFWQATLQASCGDVPCLKSNPGGTTFRGKVGKGTVSFTRAQSGQWKLRWSAREQEFGLLDSGTAAVTLSAGGETFTGSAEGAVKSSALVVR